MKYSKLPRIYVHQKVFTGQIIEFNAADRNYISNVLRMKNGFEIRVFNELDGEFIAELIYDQRGLCALIRNKIRSARAGVKKVTLLISIIKQDKFESAIDMCVQMGVTDIIPVITERVQRRELNYQRLEKIILESARQSERLDIARIKKESVLSSIDYESYDQVFFANEDEIYSKDHELPSHNIALLIGPEGGFTQDEILYLKSKRNICSVTLGCNILRSETAAIALLTKVTL